MKSSPFLGLGFFIFFAAFISNGYGADYSYFYQKVDLEKHRHRYERNLKDNFSKLLLGNLTNEERLQVGEVSLEVPLYGAEVVKGDLFAYYTTSGMIIIPAFNVKFLDDISVAISSLFHNNETLEKVIDYIGMLKYCKTGGILQRPLEALQVPEIALKDSDVDEFAQQILKVSLLWIMAHELGHVYYHHPGYVGISVEEMQKNEIAADAFATEILRRIGVPPTAITYTLLLMAHWAPMKVEFRNNADWQVYIKSKMTHPITTDRLRLIAMEIQKNTHDFAIATDNPQATENNLEKSFARLNSIADILDDEGYQKLFIYKSTECLK